MKGRIWSKYWSYRLLGKCRRNYYLKKIKGIKRESEKERDRESIYREYLTLKGYAKNLTRKSLLV